MAEAQENFRLIAIRPNNNCNTVFTKVLTKGRLYKFYEEFEFYKSDTEIAGDGDAIKFYRKNESAVPKDLYKINDLDINISAVVGKNGCGKSTLIELILYTIYKLGTTLKDKDGKYVLQPYFEEIQDQIDANAAKIKEYESRQSELNSSFKSLEDIEGLSELDWKKISDAAMRVLALQDLDFKIKELQVKKGILEKQTKESKEEHSSIHKGLKCSIYFEINGAVCRYSTTYGFSVLEQLDEVHQRKRDPMIRRIKINGIRYPESFDILYSFFYTIILNYSHYALNSNSLGYWITTLFHKNDGYKTPAVITPMRTGGIIDINNENDLAKARLLSNVLVEAFHKREERSKIKLTDKQYIHKVRFTLNSEKKEVNRIKQIELAKELPVFDKKKYAISDYQTSVSIIMELLPHYFKRPIDFTELQNENIPFYADISNYMVIKVFKVLKKYTVYDSLENFPNYVIYLRTILKGLKEDKSHVIFKIERALYYLSRLYDKEGTEFWGLNGSHADFDLYELLEWMQINEEADLPYIFSRIPPSIFKIDFILDSSETVQQYSEQKIKNLPTFSGLSSGEQQKIHIINGVVYHLNNIYSIHNSNPEAKRIKYHYVNIVFDEIELYFHPDLQKEFIYDLLENIKRLVYINTDSQRRIKGLNFIFSTHSPFILSDIPIQNILKLQYDETIQRSMPLEDGRQTFAANIHDLLANNFFFKDKIFIGKKADDYLKELIMEISDLREKNKNITYDKSLTLQQKAFLIGESFFREKLLEMIRELEPDMTEDEKIEILLDRKRKEIEELEKQKRSNSNNDTNKPSQP